VTFFMNEAVAAAKLAGGYMTGSVGLVSDGFHSLFDGLTNVMGLIGVRMASEPPDPEHPYGHRKYETLFTVFVAALIFLTGMEIVRHAWGALWHEARAEAPVGSFVLLGVTSAVNIGAMVYELRRARVLGSEFLRADALHTASNLAASAGVLIGLVFVRMGYPKADAIAGLVVAVLVARTGMEVLRGASDVLVDRICLDTRALERACLGVEGVVSCHGVRSRGSVDHMFVDLHIQLRADTPLAEAHRVAHEVQARVKAEFPGVAEVLVHMEPDADG
jgi:cation diffusion facilitator family transporter